MKKKPANHVKDLAEGESGSQLIKEGDDLLTAINMYVCSITKAIANPTKAQAAHNKGTFPLPL
jgi:hypothetical protein